MGGDIHNISVLTANLFLSCRDSHSNPCQKAIKWNGLFPASPVYKPNWVGHDTVHLAVVCGVACCQGTKAPAWQGHVIEQREHLHSPSTSLSSTFKTCTGEEKQLCSVTVPQTIAVLLRSENAAAYCTQCESESCQLMSSCSFLPGKFYMTATIGSLSRNRWMSLNISVSTSAEKGHV